jgi:hypothetical protein
VVPIAFAVSRSDAPFGAAESENGFTCHQRLWPGKRHSMN